MDHLHLESLTKNILYIFSYNIKLLFYKQGKISVEYFHNSAKTAKNK